MNENLFSKLENYRKRKRLSVLALCRQLDMRNVNYYRWKENDITGPYKKIVEEFLNKHESSKDSPLLNIPSDIAVVGISCYYPGAHNIKELWENILARKVQFRRILDKRLPLDTYYDKTQKETDKIYAAQAAVIDNFKFEWSKWRIPKKTYESTDIVHWLALDRALKALEDAGYIPSKIPIEKTGVILGNTLTGEQTRSQTLRLRWPYVQKTLKAALHNFNHSPQELQQISQTMENIYKSAFYPMTEDSLSGGLANTIAGRICNYLNLKGGGYIVDGACASSLLAVATAANSLKMRDLDIAIAGGVDISLDPFELVGFSRAGALARNQMRVYDKKAEGFIPGEGCGFVVLKRLEDAVRDKDYVYAVIKGWGVSSDGKGGMMEPSVNGQMYAIQRAYSNIGYTISDVDFVEGHGTGTVKGDMVELESVSNSIYFANGKAKARRCGVTSFKSIVGHTKAAAGIGGLIKTILAVNQRILPPTANCREPNEIFESKAKYIYPLLQGKICPADKDVRAGVSAAGFGGINCHITLESKDRACKELKPEIDERALLATSQETEIFIFAARSIKQIKSLIKKFKEDLRFMSIAEMPDFAAWLSKNLKQRAPLKVAVITDTPENLYQALCLLEQELDAGTVEDGGIKYLKSPDPNTQIIVGNNVKKNRVGFIFPGQGSQKLQMTRVLFERYAWARKLMALAERPLFEQIYPPAEKLLTGEEKKAFEKKLSRTEITQPAVCLSSLIWIEFLSKLGIEPDVVGGHSLGELTAFCKAGMMSKKTFVRFAEFRGKVMSVSSRTPAGMVSLFCSFDQAEGIVDKVKGSLVLANINSPKQTVVSGAKRDIEKAVKLAQKENIEFYRLPVSSAFHCGLMKPAADKIGRSSLLKNATHSGNVKLYSCIDGQLLTGKIDLKDYFSRQTVSPVNFVTLVESMSKDCDLLVEVGPSRVLSNLVRVVNEKNGPKCIPVEGTPNNDSDLNIVLAQAFIRNISIKWAELYKNRLIRQFVPVSRKRFIENQCERPLALTKVEVENVPDTVKFSAGDKKDNITNILVNLAQKITGYDKESITMDLRLLDDLNLDSIKAGELIAEATRILGIAGEIDPSQHSNKQLSQIRDILYENALLAQKAGGSAQKEKDILKRYLDKSWVRDFVVEYKSEQINPNELRDLRGIKKLEIICESDEKNLADTLKKQFGKAGIKTDIYGYENGTAACDGFICILPKPKNGGGIDSEGLRRSIERLHSVVKLSTKHEGSESKEVVFIQFGNGSFGEEGSLVDITSACAKALASTLHLEWPELKIKVLDFDARIEDLDISKKVIEELKVGGSFSAAGYDGNLERKVPVFVHKDPVYFEKRKTSFGTDDVIIVTGGAKGITAQCAYAFAKKYNSRMILIGRSEISNKKDDEISKTLDKFKTSGLNAAYYSTDVTKDEVLSLLVDEVQKKYGKITGVIHGAGLNSVKRLKNTDTEDAYKECRVKVLGAVNLSNALRDNNLKMFAAFTSVIGVTGMEGSGWYGFANEVLNLFLCQYKAQNQKTEVLSLAYSVWDEVGMGIKLGTMKWLAGQGISAIPIEEGVKRFMQLIEKDSGSQQTMVIARTSGLDTWKVKEFDISKKLRFIEDVKVFFPNVELIAQCRLNTEVDSYVLDHNWKGSLLLPLVFGLEAMAQAYYYLTGIDPKVCLKFMDIQLERAIPVNQEQGTKIEIHALVLERESGKDSPRVKVDIYCEQSNFTQPHFSAVLEIDHGASPGKPPASLIKSTQKCIDLDVETDIYGPILFQSGPFQRIEKIHELHYDEKMRKGRCIFSSSYGKASNEFLEKNKNFDDFIIGDPFFIDSLFQSMQLIVAQDACLPSFIGSISLKSNAKLRLNTFPTLSDITKIDDSFYKGNAKLSHSGCDIDIENCKLKILEDLPDNPKANEIADPSQRIQKLIDNKLRRIAQEFDLELPVIKCLVDSRLKTASKALRHEIEKPLIHYVVNQVLINHGKKKVKKIEVNWLTSGRPVIMNKELKDINISLSHDGSLMICVGEYGEQACDIETVKQRSEKDWSALLGKVKSTWINKLLKENNSLSLNQLGTLVWCAEEVAKKLANKKGSSFKVNNFFDSVFLLNLGDEKRELQLIAFPILYGSFLLRYICFLAKQIQGAGNKKDIEENELKKLRFDKDIFGFDLDFSGPQKQLVFTKRFPITFRATQSPSRKVYFTNYFGWMGEVREYAGYSIFQKIYKMAEQGGWGMATNYVQLEILGDIDPRDIVEVRLWQEYGSGNHNEVMNVKYDWRKVDSNGAKSRVAISTMGFSWLKILGHGIVKAEPLPPFLRNFFDTMLPKSDLVQPLEPLPNYYRNLTLGDKIFEDNIEAKQRKPVISKEIMTSTGNSNFIGNIYFANYGEWMGHVRDVFFNKVLNKHFKQNDVKGEWLCINCSINYLREAMPYDNILVNMYVDAIYQSGIELSFSYYLLKNQKMFKKLAVGKHKMIWAKRDRDNNPIALDLPNNISNILQEKNR